MPVTLTAAEALHAAAAAILSDDPDRAATENGVGYSKADGSIGRAIVAVPPAEWDAEFTRTAWVVLRKYRGQLERQGIDFAAIPEPPAEAATDRDHVRHVAAPRLAEAGARAVAAESSVDYRDGEYVVTFVQYDSKLVSAVKAIPGRRWNGKANVLPETSALKVAEFADSYGLALTDAAADAISKAVESFDAETVTEAVANYRPTIKVGIDSEGFFVDLPYELNERRFSLKSDVGPRFDGTAKVWRAAVNSANAAKLLAWCATQTDIEVSADARSTMESEAKAAIEALEASEAMDADIDIPGLAEGISLMPFQRGGVAYGVERATGVIGGDEMGLGKTPQGEAIIVVRQAFPCVNVVPNQVAVNWKKEWNKFFPEVKVLLVEGTIRRDIPDGYDVYIVPDSIIGDRWEDAAALYPKGLLADELHRFKNGNRQAICPDCDKRCGRENAVKCPNCYADIRGRVKSRWTVKRTHGLLSLADAIRATQPEPTIVGLTGTLITNRTVEVINPLYFAGRLEDFGGEWGIKMRYCGAYKERYGWKFDGSSNSEELHQKLRMTCYWRRNKMDVLTELPPRIHAPRYLEVDAKGRARYRSIEADVINEIGARAMEKARADIEADAEILADTLASDDAKAIILRKRDLASAADFNVETELTKVNWEAQGKASTAEHLVSIGLLKQVATECKMQSVYDWLADFFEADPDRKIVIFAENIDVVEGITAHYGPVAVKVRGGMSREAKDEAVVAFQEDPAVKVLVGNLKAAAEGITLTAAHDVAFVQFGWTPAIHDQAIDRCYGRINDAHGAVGHYLMMTDTIEEDIFDLIGQKRVVTNAVNAGTDSDGEKLSVATELVARLIKRAGLPGQEKIEQGTLL